MRNKIVYGTIIIAILCLSWAEATHYVNFASGKPTDTARTTCGFLMVNGQLITGGGGSEGLNDVLTNNPTSNQIMYFGLQNPFSHGYAGGSHLGTAIFGVNPVDSSGLMALQDSNGNNQLLIYKDPNILNSNYIIKDTGTRGVTIISDTSILVKYLTVSHIIGNSGTPAISVGPGAGTGASATISGTDLSGYLTINTGTTLASSDVIVTVTFNIPYASAPKYVVLSPGSLTSAGLGDQIYYVPIPGAANGITTLHFNMVSTYEVLNESTTFIYYYQVIQ